MTALLMMYASALTGYHLIVTEIEGPLSPYWVMRVGEEMRGGGYLGAVVGFRVLVAFGPWGSAVVLGAALLVGIVLYLETPVSRIVARGRRLHRPSVSGRAPAASCDFVRGLVGEVKDLAAMLRDKRRRAQAERAVRSSSGHNVARRPEAVPSSPEPEPVIQEAPVATTSHALEQAKGAARPRGTLRDLLGRLFRDRREPLPIWDEAPVRPSSRPAPGLAVRPHDGSPPRDASAAARGASGALRYTQDESPTPWARARPRGGADAPDDWGLIQAKSRAGGTPGGSGNGAVAGDAGCAGKRPYTMSCPTRPFSNARERPPGVSARKKPTRDNSSRRRSRLSACKPRLSHVSRGPVITRYELQPAPGIKVSKIVNLADDVALNLGRRGRADRGARSPGSPSSGSKCPTRRRASSTFAKSSSRPSFRSPRPNWRSVWVRTLREIL